MSASQTEAPWLPLRYQVTQGRSSGFRAGASGAARGYTRGICSGTRQACNSRPTEDFGIFWGGLQPTFGLPWGLGFPVAPGESQPAAAGRTALIHQRAVRQRFLSLVAADPRLRGHRAQLLVAPPAGRMPTICPSPVHSRCRFQSRSAQFGSLSWLLEQRFPVAGRSHDADSNQPRTLPSPSVTITMLGSQSGRGPDCSGRRSKACCAAREIV